MKLKSTHETEAYISDGGYYVILQPSVCSHTGEDEDMRIVLSPEQLRILVVDIQVALLTGDEWWNPVAIAEAEED